MPSPRLHPFELASRRDINLWRIPLVVSLAAIALFGLTMVPDVLDRRGILSVPSWLSVGGIDDARAVLSAMMGAVATVLALIFSVSLLVLSMIATLFGPRLVYRFLKDWVTQATIGLFMGTFIYVCLCFLVTRHDGHSHFVPQVSLMTSWLLVVGSFAFLVFYTHRIATSIQNPDMVARVVDDLSPALISSHERSAGEGTGAPPDDAAILRRADAGASVPCRRSGYLQYIDHGALVAAARDAGALVVLRFRPGQFVLHGEPVASIVPASDARRLEEAVDRHVVVGRHRTLTQDSEFVLAQIVEIAIRAMSPAINDTFTCVACVDWLADALLALSEKPPLEGHWYDSSGELRVWMPAVRLERLVKFAFDQIRQASATTPAVLIRQVDMIRRLGPRVPEAARRALGGQLDAIRHTTASLAPPDRHDLDAACDRAGAAL
jgi:uncharacterized membrane protein